MVEALGGPNSGRSNGFVPVLLNPVGARNKADRTVLIGGHQSGKQRRI